jgi:hypothetical protein
MKLYIILFLFSITNILLAQSPYTNILISSQFSPEEPSICMNPKNTNLLVAGANIDSYYFSTNGGSSWTSGTLVSTYQVWGDPIISVDTLGNFLYFHLVNGNYFIDRMGMQKSTDNGVTWSAGTFWQYNPPRAEQDKEGVAVDWTHGPRGNTIYVAWTQFDHYGSTNPADSSNIFFAKSTDDGNSFGGIVRLNQVAGDCRDEDYTQEGAVPCVGPNGEVYIAWAGPLGINNFKIFFTKFTDNGPRQPGNIIAATQRGGWDYVVSGIYRNNGLPASACDISNGPYRGTIYVNYTDSAGPADHDVMVIKSTNGGLNWSAPIRVNDDAPGKEQFFSWMAIDQVTGYIYIVFYDRRNYTDNNTDVFLARSTNGGTTWINERISSSPFVPNSGTFFGDYNGITVHNGKVRPIWTRLSGSNTSVWTALIEYPVGINPVTSEIPKSFALHQNYPNPFNPVTKIRFDIPASASGEISLKVYNELGKEAATLINDRLNAGTYEIEWDASGLASGVYFYKLSAKDLSETRRLVLVK